MEVCLLRPSSAYTQRDLVTEVLSFLTPLKSLEVLSLGLWSDTPSWPSASAKRIKNVASIIAKNEKLNRLKLCSLRLGKEQEELLIAESMKSLKYLRHLTLDSLGIKYPFIVEALQHADLESFVLIGFEPSTDNLLSLANAVSKWKNLRKLTLTKGLFFCIGISQLLSGVNTSNINCH
jgi:hypothetical protein